jgi:alkylation response protein AidB-like acyl-CoA dehydrogenase
VDFAFSEEQEEFRGILRRFTEERWSLADVRRLLDTPEGYDRSVWKQMAEELGLQGLIIPEPFGGQGFGFLELGIALEELGRDLAGGPLLSTVSATLAILNTGSQADHERWLPGIAAGDAVAGLAHLEDAGLPRPEDVATVCRPDGGGFRLTGRKVLVLDAPNLDLLVVSARREGARGSEGVGLFVVSAQADGLSVETVEPLDLSRRLGDVELDATPAQRLGADDALAALARTLDEAAVAQSAEMVGGAAGCLDMAVEYAKTRVQFARPIGSFQAIQHKAAEVLLELECARSPIGRGGWPRSGAAISPRQRALPRARVRTPSSAPPRRTSRSTGGSGSPGSTTATSSTGVPRPPTRSSAAPELTARGWRSISASRRAAGCARSRPLCRGARTP